ncbi:RNA-binding S4 domain-containing protein [Leucothrix arctica]|uniref:Heat shock protein 15 n=1 Tax=Leucothrix arctica TaxID=1481894 RepID=A0A317CII5_9GAMM|nr:S4 domain-containing protein [Leucothrix arctica]PWQ97991.1 RNA-binding protein [Leucothrix arctica]
MANNSKELVELRLDKWLWASRFFKTRAMAVEAISGGKVHLNGVRVKPARVVRCDDELNITRGVERFHVTVKGLNDKRRPAKEAVLLYEETEESIKIREDAKELNRLQSANIKLPTQKPNKRDRRLMDRFKGRSD